MRGSVLPAGWMKITAPSASALAQNGRSPAPPSSFPSPSKHTTPPLTLPPPTHPPSSPPPGHPHARLHVHDPWLGRRALGPPRLRCAPRRLARRRAGRSFCRARRLLLRLGCFDHERTSSLGSGRDGYSSRSP